MEGGNKQSIAERACRIKLELKEQELLKERLKKENCRLHRKRTEMYRGVVASQQRAAEEEIQVLGKRARIEESLKATYMSETEANLLQPTTDTELRYECEQPIGEEEVGDIGEVGEDRLQLENFQCTIQDCLQYNSSNSDLLRDKQEYLQAEKEILAVREQKGKFESLSKELLLHEPVVREAVTLATVDSNWLHKPKTRSDSFVPREQITQQEPPLLRLPDECMLHILSYLEPSDLRTLEHTCLKLKRLCHDPLLFRSLYERKSKRGLQLVDLRDASNLNEDKLSFLVFCSETCKTPEELCFTSKVSITLEQAKELMSLDTTTQQNYGVFSSLIRFAQTCKTPEQLVNATSVNISLEQARDIMSLLVTRRQLVGSDYRSHVLSEAETLKFQKNADLNESSVLIYEQPPKPLLVEEMLDTVLQDKDVNAMLESCSVKLLSTSTSTGHEDHESLVYYKTTCFKESKLRVTIKPSKLPEVLEIDKLIDVGAQLSACNKKIKELEDQLEKLKEIFRQWAGECISCKEGTVRIDRNRAPARKLHKLTLDTEVWHQLPASIQQKLVEKGLVRVVEEKERLVCYGRKVACPGRHVVGGMDVEKADRIPVWKTPKLA